MKSNDASDYERNNTTFYETFKCFINYGTFKSFINYESFKSFIKTSVILSIIYCIRCFINSNK